MRITDDLEICSLRCRLEVSVVRAETPSVLMREVHDECALVSPSIVSILITESRAASRSDKRARERTRVAIRRDDHWPMPAALCVTLITNPAFLRPEYGRHLGPAPSGGALCFPSVEVGRMAPLVDLGIHIGRTAQHLSTRCKDAPPLDRSLWFALKRPIERCLEEL